MQDKLCMQEERDGTSWKLWLASCSECFLSERALGEDSAWSLHGEWQGREHQTQVAS
jgi:hypothetical protein